MVDHDEKLCGLCLNPCSDDFEAIDECARQALDSLCVKLEHTESEHAVMCTMCSESLQNAFDFKSMCLSTEDYVSSFTHSYNDAKVNLKDVYISKSGNVKDSCTSEEHFVCRFCLTLAEGESFALLSEEKKEVILVRVILQKYFPELNINITEDPIICTCCHISLKNYYKFVAEEKINQCYKVEVTNNECPVKLDSELEYKDDLEMIKIEETYHDDKNNAYSEVKVDETLVEVNKQNSYIKTEEIDIKMDETDYNCNQELPVDLSDKGTLASKMHKCDTCLYETQNKHCLRQHMLSHKVSSEVSMYKCEVCEYESKYKGNLKLHMVTHEEPSKITKYTCEICGYETKHKHHLTHHRLTHKSRAELDTFKCALCTYEAKNKSHLKQHMEVHSGTTMYKCERCTYQGKHKRCFKRHLLTHKNSTEVKMYKCDACVFETKHKGCLQRHQLIHMDVSEIKMYKCEVCAHQTKTKGNLKLHMRVHRKRRKQ